MLRIKFITDNSSDYLSTEEHTKFDDASLMIRRHEENKSLNVSFATKITFYGSAYNYIKTKIIDNPTGKVTSIPVEIYDDCCDETIFYGEIRGTKVDWCEDSCSVQCDIMERSTNTTDCIRNTYVWADKAQGTVTDPNFANQDKPFVRYCIETSPDVLHVLINMMIQGIVPPLIYIMVWVGIIATAINIIIGALNVVINGLNGIIPGPGPISRLNYIGDGDISFFDDAFEGFKTVIATLYGCNRGHPSPFLWQYIKNGCEKCGLTFKSSILYDTASDYYRAVMLYAPVKKGVTYDYNNSGNMPKEWIDKNKPLYTVADFLDLIKPLFNGDYRIQGTELIFERKDYFRTVNEPLDLSAGLEHPDVIEICYEYADKDMPAYAEYNWAKDPIEMHGNGSLQLYEDIVEWNPNNQYPNLKGKYSVQFQIACPRFRLDGIDPDWNAQMSEIFGPFSTLLPGGNMEALFGSDVRFWLCMAQHTTSFPKILVLEENYDLKNAKVVKQEQPGSSLYYYFNTPMWVSAAEIQGSVKPHITPNLYTRFLYIDEPTRILDRRGIQFTIKIFKKCEYYQRLKSLDTPIKLPNGHLGVVNELSIKNDTIEITGIF